MSAAEAVLAALVAAAFWFWADSMRAREIAAGVARRACAAEGVQLLDDTVMTVARTLRRDGYGHLRVMRTYEFEFSDSGNNRLTGALTLLGGELQSLYFPPRFANAR